MSYLEQKAADYVCEHLVELLGARSDLTDDPQQALTESLHAVLVGAVDWACEDWLEDELQEAEQKRNRAFGWSKGIRRCGCCGGMTTLSQLDFQGLCKGCQYWTKEASK